MFFLFSPGKNSHHKSTSTSTTPNDQMEASYKVGLNGRFMAPAGEPSLSQRLGQSWHARISIVRHLDHLEEINSYPQKIYMAFRKPNIIERKKHLLYLLTISYYHYNMFLKGNYTLHNRTPPFYAPFLAQPSLWTPGTPLSLAAEESREERIRSHYKRSKQEDLDILITFQPIYPIFLKQKREKTNSKSK